jgi:hypothetical protein
VCEGEGVEPALGAITHDRQIDSADRHDRSADLLEDDSSAGEARVDGRDLHRPVFVLSH